jgi:hypothetical protein
MRGQDGELETKEQTAVRGRLAVMILQRPDR